jgi:hypothetical protein
LLKTGDILKSKSFSGSRGFGKSKELQGSGVFAVTNLFDDSVGLAISDTLIGSSQHSATSSLVGSPNFRNTDLFTNSGPFSRSSPPQVSKSLDSDQPKASGKFAPSVQYNLSSSFSLSSSFAISSVFTQSRPYLVSQEATNSANLMKSQPLAISSEIQTSNQLRASSVMASVGIFTLSTSFVTSTNLDVSDKFRQTRRDISSRFEATELVGSVPFKATILVQFTNKLAPTGAYVASETAKQSQSIISSIVFTISDPFHRTVAFTTEVFENTPGLIKTSKLDDSSRFGVSNKHRVSLQFADSQNADSLTLKVSSFLIASVVFANSDKHDRSNSFTISDLHMQSGDHISRPFAASVPVIYSDRLTLSKDFQKSDHFTYSNNFDFTNSLFLSLNFDQSLKFDDSQTEIESILFKATEILPVTNKFVLTNSVVATLQLFDSIIVNNSERFYDSDAFITNVFRLSIIPAKSEKLNWTATEPQTNDFVATKSENVTNRFVESYFMQTSNFAISNLFTASDYLEVNQADAAQALDLESVVPRSIISGVAIGAALLLLVLLALVMLKRRSNVKATTSCEMTYETEERQTRISDCDDDLADDSPDDEWDLEEFDQAIVSAFKIDTNISQIMSLEDDNFALSDFDEMMS